MKKSKLFSKLNKLLITVICTITLVFSMPVKSEASIIEDFLNLLLGIPDAVMWGMNRLIADSDTSTSEKVNCKGWGAEGRIYKFDVTPYEIFSSGRYEEEDVDGTPVYVTKLGLFDANFFSDKNIISEKGGLVSSEILKVAVSKVYIALRNLCLILMLLVLLYIGIRIIISSASQQQAKYKQLLFDWLVGVCLLFTMHYIMAFIMSINSIAVQLLQNDEGDSYYVGLADLMDNGRGTDSSWYDLMTTGTVYDYFSGSGGKKFLKEKIVIRGEPYENYGFNINKFPDDPLPNMTYPYRICRFKL